VNRNHSRQYGPILLSILLVVFPGFAEDSSHTWSDAVKDLGLNPDEIIFPFRANEEMRRWADQQLLGYRGHTDEKQLRALQRALFDPSAFHFEYDPQGTYSAEEAFRIRRGNCLSFTALFIAISRSVGLPVSMVMVEKLPEIENSGDLVVINRHVVAGIRGTTKITLYDFYVTTTTPFLRREFISDIRASAMFHNNIGAQALRSGDLEEARRNFIFATTLAPEWAGGWLSLGLCEARAGHYRKALEIYRRAEELDPKALSVYQNMASAYHALGEDSKADEVLQKAAEKTRNPFTLIALAEIEMERDHHQVASSYIRRARWWYPREPAVWEAMSRLAAREGDMEKAEKYSLRAVALRRRRSMREP